jgi:hypothetical protein
MISVRDRFLMWGYELSGIAEQSKRRNASKASKQAWCWFGLGFVSGTLSFSLGFASGSMTYHWVSVRPASVEESKDHEYNLMHIAGCRKVIMLITQSGAAYHPNSQK